jgi:hypothetical protein
LQAEAMILVRVVALVIVIVVLVGIFVRITAAATRMVTLKQTIQIASVARQFCYETPKHEALSTWLVILGSKFGLSCDRLGVQVWVKYLAG